MSVLHLACRQMQSAILHYVVRVQMSTTLLVGGRFPHADCSSAVPNVLLCCCTAVVLLLRSARTATCVCTRNVVAHQSPIPGIKEAQRQHSILRENTTSNSALLAVRLQTSPTHRAEGRLLHADCCTCCSARIFKKSADVFGANCLELVRDHFGARFRALVAISISMG